MEEKNISYIYWPPEFLNPLLISLSDKIMGCLPHIVLMCTHTHCTEDRGPCFCMSPAPHGPAPHCMDLLWSPWLGGSAGLVHSIDAGWLPASYCCVPSCPLVASCPFTVIPLLCRLSLRDCRESCSQADPPQKIIR